MIFAADDENCLSEILIVASALEIQDPLITTQHLGFLSSTQGRPLAQ